MGKPWKTTAHVRNRRGETVSVGLSLEIDWPGIAAYLAARALVNSSRRSSMLHGLIKAKITKEPEQ